MDTLALIKYMEILFKTNSKFTDKEGKLFIPKILESIDKIDIELVKLLMSDAKAKEQFFMKIDDVYVLNQNDLIEFFTMNEYFNHSFTSYTNKIGLIKKDNFIKKFDDVVLAFPYKDCVLEGGQTKDDEKNNEVFYNSIISRDEIDRLFEPKVLTNIKRFDKDGEHEVEEIIEDDNLIIKGNNLLALHSLKKRYVGKVKLIYIDPPYNTGGDSFGYNDSFNHSTWLTFMKNRLEVAREFLSDDGVIFVTLDDNESAYLKVLCDEIFGRENFIADVIWNSRKSVQNDTVISLATNHNLFYAKNKLSLDKNDFRLAIDESKFKYDDNDGRGKYRTDPFDAPQIRKNLEYPIENTITNDIYYPPKGRHWITTESEYNRLFEDNRILFGQTGKGKPQLKKYLKEERHKGSVSTTLWSDLDTTTNATKHLEKLFGEKLFSTPKPENLIQRIIELSTNKNDLVLDFHLGSGTTCAVAHKMGRKYIGIEQMDYIEDIAVERMKKVIEGEQGGISKALEWKGGGSFVYAELKEIDNFKESPIAKLNKNMQYLPIHDLEDSNYGILEEEITINKKFYGFDDE
ncbi:Type III restriction-modification system methylation subunit [hydrothermal vent metagenome]|uniref:Type III restriction-modification system methylation subunit n=1 Tax=hydrothermal vent metagenome TaxID=652676 RepID=A0A1W1BCL4_9ZZZZ